MRLSECNVHFRENNQNCFWAFFLQDAWHLHYLCLDFGVLQHLTRYSRHVFYLQRSQKSKSCSSDHVKSSHADVILDSVDIAFESSIGTGNLCIFWENNLGGAIFWRDSFILKVVIWQMILKGGNVTDNLKGGNLTNYIERWQCDR